MLMVVAEWQAPRHQRGCIENYDYASKGLVGYCHSGP